MISQNSLYYLMALTRVHNIGAIKARKLLDYFKDAQLIFKSSREELTQVHKIGNAIANNIVEFSDFSVIDKELDFIRKNNIEIISILDSNYSELLKQCPDAPLILFKKGTFDCNSLPALSIVGTRNMTMYGKQLIEKTIDDLQTYQPTIVSGYASGADITAHLEAVRNHLKTIAVLGHGFQTTYPSNHKQYNNLIENNGGFLTEFWSGDFIAKENFVKRNRIVAGISQGTLVVESASKGGALITAKLANDYNRDVFAFSGRVSDFYSSGCNELIKTNQALLCTSAEDIAQTLQWLSTKNIFSEKHVKESIKSLPEHLTGEEKQIITYLSKNPKEILDTIALENKLTIQQVNVILFNLEMQNLIKALPGKRYEIID